MTLSWKGRHKKVGIAATAAAAEVVTAAVKALAAFVAAVNIYTAVKVTITLKSKKKMKLKVCQCFNMFQNYNKSTFYHQI